MKRALSLLAWLAALVTLILTTAPAAIAQDPDDTIPPDDPALFDDPTFTDPSFDEPAFDDPTFGDPTLDDVPLDDLPPPLDDAPVSDAPPPLTGTAGQYTYPAEWDPAIADDVVSADYLFGPGSGFVINTETRDIYDPLEGVVIQSDGTVVHLESGAVLLVDPMLANPPLPGEPLPGLGDPTAAADGAETSETADQGVGENETNAANDIDELEAADPILSLFRTGFTTAELDGYADDLDGLPDGGTDDSFQFLVYEIAVLVEAGAFDSTTPWYASLLDVHAQFDIERPTDRQLLSTFAAVDLEFARREPLYREAMEAAGDDAYDFTLYGLEGELVDRLRDGDQGFLRGHQYAATLLRLMAGGPDIELAADGSGLVDLSAALTSAVAQLDLEQDLNELFVSPDDSRRTLLDDFSDPAIVAALTILDAEAPTAATTDVDSGSDSMLLLAIAGGGAALALVAAFALLRRGRTRRRSRADRADAQGEALATNQLLAGAESESEIVAILHRAGERQVAAPMVLFYVEPDGLRRAGASQIIVASDLQRVITTGQLIKTTLHDDPAFPGGDQAVLGVPVVHRGTVYAVLVAHRDAAKPFGAAERDAMEPIAPTLGGVLQRIAEIDTMSELAMIDGLTSLGNRRRLDGDFETTLTSAVAGDARLGFAMVDVDHFKTYNDTHGHNAGDEVLRRVAATIASAVRETDVVYRYGGEEFSMLLPGATPDEVAAVAERVRAAVEAEEFPGEERQPGGRLTVSIGIATLASGSSDDIRERADQALYRAKEQGRNQVAHA